MAGFFNSINIFDGTERTSSSAYNRLFMLTGVSITIYALARTLASAVEATNNLNYESHSARVIAGFMALTVRMLHTRAGDLELTDTAGKLITVGPHRTGWEAIVVASKIKGTPPRFFANDLFTVIPGVSYLMKTFKAIPVISNASKGKNGQSANSSAIDAAIKALEDHECVALFPQGNFSRIGQDPHKIYDGAARIAVKTNTPVQVIRLDGYWSLQNFLIPLFVRNSLAYRSVLSGFHMNNIRATLCGEINSHLKPENQHLTEEEKIEAINAELYSFYRYTDDLDPKQIEAIKNRTSPEQNLSIWHKKNEQYRLQKEIEKAKKEEAELVEPILSEMRNIR